MQSQTISSQIIKQLKLPKPNSRKRDNGRLLIIAGSKKYFGALVYAIKTASKIVDLVFLLSTSQNQKLVEKLKLQTAEFMPIDKFPNAKLLADIDCILIGPGLEPTAATKKLTLQVLKSGKKAVLDADALNVLNNNLKKYLSPQHILTPHHKEFFRLFKLPALPKNALIMAKKNHCHIVLKGPVDVIASPNGKMLFNKTGNAGMTKGGTGDVLAGLIAGLYSTNTALISACAGCYINGLAGDQLFKKFDTFYNAEDLNSQLPITLHQLTKNS